MDTMATVDYVSSGSLYGAGNGGRTFFSDKNFYRMREGKRTMEEKETHLIFCCILASDFQIKSQVLASSFKQ